MPDLYLRAGKGWRDVEGVLDVRVQDGEFTLENGSKEMGMQAMILMRYSRTDVGQRSLRKLVAMYEYEPRAITGRIDGAAGNVEIHMLPMEMDTNPDSSDVSLYVIYARVLKIHRETAHLVA